MYCVLLCWQSEPLPPCHVNKPTVPPPDPILYPPLRQLNDTPGTAPSRRTPSLSSTATAGTGRASVASFRTVHGWEEEAKDGGITEKTPSHGWMRDEEKDGVEEMAGPTNKRKRGAQLWGEDEDAGCRAGRRDSDGKYGGRGRGRRSRGDQQEYDEERKSFFTNNEDAKQPFMSGNAALAIDAAKRGHLGGGGQPAQSGVGGARPSGLASSKRKFAPPRPINAVPELAEAVPPMMRAALAGPPTADSYSETDPAKVEKLKGTLAQTIQARAGQHHLIFRIMVGPLTHCACGRVVCCQQCTTRSWWSRCCVTRWTTRPSTGTT